MLSNKFVKQALFVGAVLSVLTVSETAGFKLNAAQDGSNPSDSKNMIVENFETASAMETPNVFRTLNKNLKETVPVQLSEEEKYERSQQQADESADEMDVDKEGVRVYSEHRVFNQQE